MGTIPWLLIWQKESRSGLAGEHVVVRVMFGDEAWLEGTLEDK